MFTRLFALATAVSVAIGLLLITLSPPVAATSNSVLIDAVLYDGYETGDSDEAVRIRNISDQPIDVAGWRLNDGESATAVIPFTTTLAPNQAIWLAKDGLAFFKQFGFAPDFQKNDSWPGVPLLDGLWPNLANTGDQVLLLDSDGIVIDCLAYENNSGQDCGIHWQGTAVDPYRPSTAFGVEGQILYRIRHPETGLTLPDSNTAVDWAQHSADPIHGRKVQYPGWDLDDFFWTAQLTETAVVTIAIAPDNAYETVAQQIRSAQSSLYIESHTIENLAIAQDLLDALSRGVSVTLLLEGGPPGGVSDQERYICQLIEAANGRCWFMINHSEQNIYDRYTYIHAKFILIDGQRVIVSSENLSPRSLAHDDKSDGTWGRRGVLLVTDAPGVVSHVQAIFAKDFDPATHADITGTQAIGGPPPGFVPITQTGGTTYTVRHPTPFVVQGTFAFELVQSPENSLRPSDGLLGLLNQAGAGDIILAQQLDERPYWGATSSDPQSDPNLRLEAAIAAGRRGATVRFMLDSYFDTGGAVSNSATCDYVNGIAQAEQLDMACKLANPTGEGIHNKMYLVQIDGRGTIHVGSINGTELSSKGNRELALQLQSDAAYAYLAKMFWQDWGFTAYLPIVPNAYYPPARHLLISEIMYDPPGASDDGEFIELVNPTSQTIDLSHFSIGDAVLPTDYEDVRRFPSGTLLQPGQTLVIAVAGTAFRSQYGFDPDFEVLNTDPLIPDLIDDPAWGDPSTFLRLGNSGDELILRDANNQVVDAVAYGTGHFPGVVTCPLVSAPNFSLERYPYWQDSNDCTKDFREWAFPNPGTLP